MNEVKKKARVGIALLNLPATLGYSRYEKIKDENGEKILNDLSWGKEIDAIDDLEQVAEKMDLDTIFILGVSPEVIEYTSDGDIDYHKETTNRDCWHLSKALHYGTQIWYHTLYFDGDKPYTPRIRYLGAVGCNCFFTPDYSKFAKQNGEPIEFDRRTAKKLKSGNISSKIDSPNNSTTFDYIDSTFDYLTRITKDCVISREESFGKPCFRKTAENMLEQLKDLSENYDLRQVIVCTNGLTEQPDGKNMIDSNQISQVCGAPVFEIWTNLYNPCPGSISSSITINPEGDGFKGKCIPGDYCAFGFATGMHLFSSYINKTKETDPKKKERTAEKGNQ